MTTDCLKQSIEALSTSVTNTTVAAAPQPLFTVTRLGFGAGTAVEQLIVNKIHAPALDRTPPASDYLSPK